MIDFIEKVLSLASAILSLAAAILAYKASKNHKGDE